MIVANSLKKKKKKKEKKKKKKKKIGGTIFLSISFLFFGYELNFNILINHTVF